MNCIIRHTVRASLVLSMALLALAWGATAQAVEPNSYEQTWTNDMNQASYWLPWNCTKYENHSGQIPAKYDAAIIKDGSSVVKVYPDLTNVGAFTATGAINPNNQKPYGAPHSWVMKCTKPPVETTTTTEPVTTTSEVPSTTSPATTTTAPTTTSPSSTTTSSPPETTPTTTPVTEPPSSTTPTVDTTSPDIPVTPTPTPELPATGWGSWVMAIIATVFIALGWAFVATARRD